MSRQSSKLPWTWMSWASWAIAWPSLPIAILPSGTSTAAVMPACAAYAAADADVLPVDAQMTAFAPCSIAFETAMVMPRSLNDPVGFMPSYLTQTFAPVRAESAGARMSGVPPSPRVTTASRRSRPRRSPYSCSTPRHCVCHVRLLRLADTLTTALTTSLALRRRRCRGERLLAGLVGADHEASDGRAVLVVGATVCSTVSTETPRSARMRRRSRARPAGRRPRA